MYRKSKKGKNFLIVLCIVFCCLLVSSFFVYKEYSIPGLFLRDGIIGVTNIIKWPFSFFNDRDLVSSNNYLESEVNRLKNVEVENNLLKSEINSLRNSFSLNSLQSDVGYVNASVVNRNLDYWSESFIIDKGKSDGIESNMAVVYNGVMIGVTSNVSYGSSEVLLFSNSKFPMNISVKIDVSDDSFYGILNNYSNGVYDVVGVVENVNIPIGSTVTTTGFGNKIPAGLVIGDVSSIVTDNFDLSKVVHVNPIVSFDDIRYVSVVYKEAK